VTAQTDDTGPYGELEDMKMLLVDDNEWVRDSLSLLFEAEGCHLLTAQTAEQAIQVLRREKCDIIISDYRLPGMDGLEFFRLVGKSHPDTMKILVTAHGDVDVASDAIRIGIDDFIQKPFTIEAIRESLKLLIEKREMNNLNPSSHG
jgi:DNA-binding NtrC family response regulator